MIRRPLTSASKILTFVSLFFLVVACGSDASSDGSGTPEIPVRIDNSPDAGSEDDRTAGDVDATSPQQQDSEGPASGTETSETGSDTAGTTDTTSGESNDTAASSDADDNGSGGTGPCPENAHLEDGSCYCNDGYVVNEDRTECVRECTTDSECGQNLVCENYSCVQGPCQPGSCAEGLVCGDGGDCVPDSTSLPSGPIPSCPDVPDWRCSGGESECGALMTFDPRRGRGYWDYPINGETSSDQYRSYARKDLIKLVKHAAAAAKCLAQDWNFGNKEPIGLGDMSEKDGAIPGTREGNPGHPDGTHENGFDIDIGYFQLNQSDNKLRPVCKHTQSGTEKYRCVATPDTLDVWRTAVFIAKLHDSPQLRVIGVDGKIGPIVEGAIEQLCSEGWIDGPACQNLKLAYETTDEGRGWYRFHHHHLHVSLTTRSNAGLRASRKYEPGEVEPLKCLVPGCKGQSKHIR